MKTPGIGERMLDMYEAGKPSADIAREFNLEIFEVHRRLYAARKRREKMACEVNRA